MTVSLSPFTSVVTTGTPSAIASSTDVGSPSRSPLAATTHGRQKTVARPEQLAHLLMRQRSPQHIAEARGRRRRRELGSQRAIARDFEPHRDLPRAQDATGRDEILEALLLDQPGDRDDQQWLRRA